MKKTLALFIVFSLCVTMLSGCSTATNNSSSETSEVTETTAEAPTVSTFKNGLSENDFEVQEYIVIPSHNEENTDCIIVIKNNSSDSVSSIEFEVTAYDAKDNVVGTGTITILKLSPGDETIGTCSFEGVKNIDHITRKLSKCEVGTFEPVNETLDIKLVEMDNMYLTYSVTNNNTKALTAAFLYVLLFDKDGNLVDYTIGGVMDRLPKGDTTVVTAWIGSAKEFDSHKMYCLAYF